jgi:hypothetical protein
MTLPTRPPAAAWQVLVRIAGNPDFELLVILVIFANCVTLALFDPWETDRGGRNGQLYYAGTPPAPASHLLALPGSGSNP